MAVAAPIIEALGDFLLSGEAQAIATDDLMTGTQGELRQAAADLVLGRSQPLEDLTGRTVVVDKNLGSLTRTVEQQNTTVMADIMKDPSKLAAVINDGAASANSAGWDAPAFIRWSVGQIWEQCLFQVAMEAAEKILRGGGTEVPQGDTLLRVTATMEALNKALQTLNQATNDWHQWLVDHLARKDTYGMATENGNLDYRFELFRRQLTGLTQTLENTLVTALGATKGGSGATYEALRKALGDYAAEVQNIGEGIRDNEPLMVADGLEDHLPELDGAVAAIGQASE